MSFKLYHAFALCERIIADTTDSMAIAFLNTVGMLWGDWNVCVIETPRSSLDKRRIFRKPTLNGLYTPFGSPICGGQKPQERGRKPPYSVLGTATL